MTADPHPTVRRTAWAKVNLHLHVLGRRPDGYHLLDSLVAFAALGDAVTLTAGPPLALALTGPFAAGLPADATNLAWRAVTALAAALGREPDVAVGLEKTLPVAAGLGGGSADAAAVLNGLADMWGVAPERLDAIGLALGADVPACLRSTSLSLGGIGEVLRPGPVLTGMPIVLANPGRPVATAAVFRALPPVRSTPVAFAGDLAAYFAMSRNDLEAPALKLEPAIGTVLAALRATGPVAARMSGSGATCFAVYTAKPAADAAAAALQAAHPGWWVRATSLL